MINSNHEIVKLLGYAAFEIWMQIVGLIVFTIILCLKEENVIVLSWWYAFIPLFVADALTFYFSMIVFIRSYVIGKKKEANRRAGWIVMTLSLFFLFKMLLCHHLEGTINTLRSYILAPVFTIWVLLLIRACRVN